MLFKIFRFCQRKDTVIPTVAKIKALHGRRFSELTAAEFKTYEFYRKQGKSLGVSVRIILPNDLTEFPISASLQELEQFARTVPSKVSVTVTTPQQPSGKLAC